MSELKLKSGAKIDIRNGKKGTSDKERYVIRNRKACQKKKFDAFL